MTAYYYDLHGREDDNDAVLDEIAREHAGDRCECGGRVVAQFSGVTGVVALRCAECDALVGEVEL